MIIDIFLTQGQGVETLSDPLFQSMIDRARIALIVEAFCQRARDTQAWVDLTQEQNSAVTGEVTAGEIGHDFAWTQVLKKQQLGATVWGGGRDSLHIRNLF